MPARRLTGLAAVTLAFGNFGLRLFAVCHSPASTDIHHFLKLAFAFRRRTACRPSLARSIPAGSALLFLLIWPVFLRFHSLKDVAIALLRARDTGSARIRWAISDAASRSEARFGRTFRISIPPRKR
jgi:hypothetical protein